ALGERVVVLELGHLTRERRARGHGERARLAAEVGLADRRRARDGRRRARPAGGADRRTDVIGARLRVGVRAAGAVAAGAGHRPGIDLDRLVDLERAAGPVPPVDLEGVVADRAAPRRVAGVVEVDHALVGDLLA